MTTPTLETTNGLAWADFLHDPDPRPYELHDGRKVYLTVAETLGHSDLCNVLGEILRAYARQHGGKALIGATFVSEMSRQWVRGSLIPDVLYIRAERWQAYQAEYPDWADAPLRLIPDVVAEVLSDNDAAKDVEAKTARYLRLGVGAVWVLDRWAKQVYVYTDGQTRHTYTETDSLRQPALLPAFDLPLRDLFSQG